MLPMTINVISTNRKEELIRAFVQVRIPDIGARARIVMRFQPESGTGPDDWYAQAYERALLMLDMA